MRIENYLARISYPDFHQLSLSSLFKLHQSHIYSIPFECLDIHLGIPITLDVEAIYKKVVNYFRGGFCYELNTLFNWLLNQLGYEASMISAQIVNNNQPGPEYDHMAICVKMESNWLLDVGYGDLFINPIEIKPDVVQYDGVNYFMIKELGDDKYSLMMSATETNFKERYVFSLSGVALEKFESQCQLKQTSEDSHFVKNLICTKPTESGRKTIFNHKFLERNESGRHFFTFESEFDLVKCLQEEFGIDIKKYQNRLAEMFQFSF
ncbi:arylamine N-acetyltransferase family protein [Emticicia fontis]